MNIPAPKLGENSNFTLSPYEPCAPDNACSVFWIAIFLRLGVYVYFLCSYNFFFCTRYIRNK